MEKSCFKIHFHFCSSQKKSGTQFFGAEYIFFVNVARFARKHFWGYSKLVGTPCMIIISRLQLVALQVFQFISLMEEGGLRTNWTAISSLVPNLPKHQPPAKQIFRLPKEHQRKRKWAQKIFFQVSTLFKLYTYRT